MKNNLITNNLGLIDPNNLKSDEHFCLDLSYDMWPDDEYKIFTKGKYFVVWEESFDPFDKIRISSQREFPLSALPWFIDTIEDKFWNHKPDPNELPGDVSERTTIDGENIGINPSKNCCAENLFGYSFWNASRKSYISKRAIHSWQIPRYMLEDSLLDELKKISTDLGLKSYT